MNLYEKLAYSGKHKILQVTKCCDQFKLFNEIGGFFPNPSTGEEINVCVAYWDREHHKLATMNGLMKYCPFCGKMIEYKVEEYY